MPKAQAVSIETRKKAGRSFQLLTFKKWCYFDPIAEISNQLSMKLLTAKTWTRPFILFQIVFTEDNFDCLVLFLLVFPPNSQYKNVNKIWSNNWLQFPLQCRMIGHALLICVLLWVWPSKFSQWAEIVFQKIGKLTVCKLQTFTQNTAGKL